MLAALLLAITLRAEPTDAPLPINIFPAPSSVTREEGSFRFNRFTQIEASGEAAPEAQFLQKVLSPEFGQVPVTEVATSDNNMVVLQIDSSREDLGPEGYTLKVTPANVTVIAEKPAGIFYGIQTIRQLLPAQIENPQEARHVRWQMPCLEITDRPKFAWRGMMLDVSRHFFPKPAIEHFLDLISMLKMNVFHWHLVDDGGWRIQIKRYPKLTDVGAWRRWSPDLWDWQHLDFPGTSTGDRVYGGFYTQDDIRDIVKYAADRHITVVPEIEMPGHNLAAMESYPQLICTDVDVKGWQQHSGYPFPNVYCAGKEQTYTFIENVLDEVCSLFPSEYVHIGGDEVDKWLWNRCPDCQKMMQQQGLKSADELQSYFVRRIEQYLNSKGKRLIGWDEILEGGLAPNAAVMSWRGIDGGIAAAQAGHNVVMSPTSHCYFDHSYQDCSTEKVFTFDPIPPDLSPDQRHFIIGAQCNLWTERVPDVPTAEERLFPRIIPLAEDLWSENKDPDLDTFMNRLRLFYPRLDALGINYQAPPPEPEFNAVLLNGPVKIAFRPLESAGCVIRYTTDGTNPTANSSEYRRPFTVSSPAVITAITFRGENPLSDPVQVNVGDYQPVDSANLVGGLDFKLFDGQFQTVPDFSKLKSAVDGNGSTIGLVGDRKENYAIEYYGYIRIDKEGGYTFGTTSDDGSDLWIGSVEVVNNDGPHSSNEKLGRIYLRPGIYPIRIGYFQLGGDQNLSVSLQGPDIPKGPIPASMLFRTP